MLRILQPSPARCLPWPERMRSSIGALNVRRLSITSKRSSPPAPSPPSPNSACPSVCTRTRRPQASALFWLKSGKERNTSSAVHLGLLTRSKKLTPPLSCNALQLSGLLRSSDHTLCQCHSRYIRTTMLCNGSRPWRRDPHCSTAGQPLWRSTIFQSNTSQGSRRLTPTASVGYPSTLLLQRTPSSKCTSWRPKRKPEDSLESSTPPPTSVGKCCGSYSATGTATKPAAISASRPLRVVPNVNWAATMDIARRRLFTDFIISWIYIDCGYTFFDHSFCPDCVHTFVSVLFALIVHLSLGCTTLSFPFPMWAHLTWGSL